MSTRVQFAPDIRERIRHWQLSRVSKRKLGIGAVGVVAERSVFKSPEEHPEATVKWQHISQYGSTEEMVEE